MPVLSCGGAMAVRWLTDVRYALGENKGKHTTAPQLARVSRRRTQQRRDGTPS
jgi:hypothetical protein